MPSPINALQDQIPQPPLPDKKESPTEAVAKHSISLTGQVLQLALQTEARMGQKVHLHSQEIKEKDETIKVLLRLKKEITLWDGKAPLSSLALESMENLTGFGIEIDQKQGREELLETIAAHTQPLHMGINRLITIDLARVQNQINTIINIAEEILRLSDRSIKNMLERIVR